MIRNLCRKFSSYIHLEYHQEIMSSKSQLFSYDNPRYFRKDKKMITVALGKRGRQHIEEKRYDEFRRGMISPKAPKLEKAQTEVEEEEALPNYFGYYYPGGTTAISSVRRNSEYNYKVKLLHPIEALTNNIDWQNLQKYTHRHLVQIALKLRHDSDKDLNRWYKVQKLLEKHIHNLSTEELIQFKYSLGGGRKKYGLADTHKKLTDILMSEMKMMNLQQLIALYCSMCRDNFRKQEVIVDFIMESPEKLKELRDSRENVTDFMDAYANYLADRHKKKIAVRVHNEYKKRDAEIISQLNLTRHMINMPINDIIRMMRCFHKLRLIGIRQEMLVANTRLTEELDSLDYYQAYDVVYCLQRLDSGDGLNMDIFPRLLPKIQENWQKYKDLEKLRMIYSFWNIGMDDLKPKLYEIPIRQDTSQLYYQCSLNMAWFDKQRTLQLAKTMYNLEYIPLPYHYRMRQFYHYAEGLLPNDLQGLRGKFYSTDDFFTPWHLFDTYRHNEDIVDFGKFLSTLALDITALYPLENTELVQYAMLGPQVAIEVIPEQAFLPNGQARKSTMLRAASFHGMRWWYIGVRWKVFKEMPRDQQKQWLTQQFDRAMIHQSRRLKGKQEYEEEQYEERLYFRPLSFFPHKVIEDVMNTKPMWNHEGNIQEQKIPFAPSNIHELNEEVDPKNIPAIESLKEFLDLEHERRTKKAEDYIKIYEQQMLKRRANKKEMKKEMKEKRKLKKEFMKKKK